MIPLNIDSLALVWREGLFNLLHVMAGNLKKMCKILLSHFAMNSIHDISWLIFLPCNIRICLQYFRLDRKRVR